MGPNHTIMSPLDLKLRDCSVEWVRFAGQGVRVWDRAAGPSLLPLAYLCYFHTPWSFSYLTFVL